MGLLLYKSDEMYSSTELIRKSKMIFNKILDDDIEKAIILRDGKPCFLLMEFQKYEKIMAEFEELKEYVSSLENSNPKKKPKQIKDPIVPQIKDPIVEEISDNIVEKTAEPEIELKKIVNEEIKEKQTIKEEPKNFTNDIPIQNITSADKTKIEEYNKSKKELEITEEQEIKDAYDSIESMNFDDAMKKEAQGKIKTKILLARQERAKILENENQNKEELKEELILQRQLKEEKMKKDRELREFWD
jgi:hypothetical protein